MKCSKIKLNKFSSVNCLNNLKFFQMSFQGNVVLKQDECVFWETNFDRTIYQDRGILKKDEKLEDFFNDISLKVFSDEKSQKEFCSLLKEGKITLSSSCYMDLKNPKSAIALELPKNCDTIHAVSICEKYVKDGTGIGINFSNQKNPIEKITRINSYLKYRQQDPLLKRPPAGIALLNVDNPHILDFINLKNNASYEDWCMDLSVVLDSDFLSKVQNDEKITLTDGSTMYAKTIYSNLLSSMLNKGEPAIIFSDDKEFICDSCACTQLKKDEPLTLGQINLSKFFNKTNNSINYEELRKTAKILSNAMANIQKGSYIGVLGYQELLDKLGLKYGEKTALEIIENSLKIIQNEAHKSNVKTAISPTGTTSRFLKTTPALDSLSNKNYYTELEVMKVAQRYLDGGISKTIYLKPQDDTSDIDRIIKYCFDNNIKGISVFKKDN